jgi:hypothetical protein
MSTKYFSISNEPVVIMLLMPADIMTHASEDASQAEDVDFLLDVSRSLKQIIIHLDTPTIGSW